MRPRDELKTEPDNLPSAEDLDAVAAEQEIVEATGPKLVKLLESTQGEKT
jgi:hypothetical protein